MKNIQTNWSKEELKIYLLIYCANADFIESTDEIDLIKSEIDEPTYKKLHKEFNHDNDFQTIEKIENTVERLGFSTTEIDELIEEIKHLFTADDNFDIQEHNLFNALKKLLHS